VEDQHSLDPQLVEDPELENPADKKRAQARERKRRQRARERSLRERADEALTYLRQLAEPKRSFRSLTLQEMANMTFLDRLRLETDHDHCQRGRGVLLINKKAGRIRGAVFACGSASCSNDTCEETWAMNQVVSALVDWRDEQIYRYEFAPRKLWHRKPGKEIREYYNTRRDRCIPLPQEDRLIVLTPADLGWGTPVEGNPAIALIDALVRTPEEYRRRRTFGLRAAPPKKGTGTTGITTPRDRRREEVLQAVEKKVGRKFHPDSWAKEDPHGVLHSVVIGGLSEEETDRAVAAAKAEIERQSKP
jgi:hypothetical protein